MTFFCSAFGFVCVPFSFARERCPGMPHRPTRRGGKAYQRKKENRIMRECDASSIPGTGYEYSD